MDACEAREHVLWLARNDMGYKRVARLAGVSESVLARLLYGVKSETQPKPPSKKIRVEHHDAILAVSACDSPTEDAGNTWQMLDCLIAFGIPRYKIAHALGYRRKAPQRPSLQISRKRVSRGNASAVKRLHWNAWHASPELRAHCRCDRPQHMMQDAA